MAYHKTKIILKCIVTTRLFSSSIHTHRLQEDKKSMWFERKETAESTVAIYRIYFTFTQCIPTCTYTQIYLYRNAKQQKNSCVSVILQAPKDKIIIVFPLPSTTTVYTP